MEIEPQVYGIRWFRLLFGREFELPDLLVVWDTIFLLDNEDDNGNFGGENQFTDWLGLALLLAYRDQLLTADYSGTLHLLMKHRHDQPPVERIQSALSLRERYPSIELAAKPPLEADLNSTTADSSLLVRNAQRTSAVSLSPRRSPSSTAAVSNVVGGGAKDFLGDLKRTIMEPVLGPLGISFCIYA
jgi:hypothetical protein